MNASRGLRRLMASTGALALAVGILAGPAAALPSSVTRGIAEFSSVPTAAQVGALKALGLTVQPMRHLPLALVSGTAAQLQAAVTSGVAEEVYPDRAIQLLDTKSSDAMGAAGPRAAGLTGKGVTVAVVDSGCDGTHPDLNDHIAHNVKLVSAEYVNQPPNSDNTIVVPIELLPADDSDLGSGHGTHVAGIIAADSTSDPTGGTHFGVAPDASLVCISIGEVLFTTAVVTAYDFLLDQPDMWGVDVINNSWGNAFRQFDPRDPVVVATKAVADLGAVVVFAAGNSGSENAEMSQNPFSQAPWVISVAAGTIDHHRSGFSSNGLVLDNSQPVTIGAGGHTVWTGDRIGVYHPDLTAPGSSISSSCTHTGTVIVCAGTNGTASGTSMASPHVAGAAAVLKQANPALTPEQVRLALQATATPVLAADGSALPFWEVGYGYVNLQAAVDLVRGTKWKSALPSAAAKADARVLASDGFKVVRTDLWQYDAPRATVAGTDTRTFSVEVPKSVRYLKVTLSHPSTGSIEGNAFSYTVTARDASGRVVGTTTESITAGSGTSATGIIDLASFQTPRVTYGEFTFEVVGNYAASDPDTLDSDSALGRVVALHVAQANRG